ncbi:unnamed protein product [Paramecium pentaurelia]|uniref:Uncharacterized protein n=1 Tax=Paramecium pentaurelia TaxID=43138 RepID=A0A8S1XVE1_9CILI|nr:unnamed protein product [Paramecium pentaurelia]
MSPILSRIYTIKVSTLLRTNQILLNQHHMNMFHIFIHNGCILITISEKSFLPLSFYSCLGRRILSCIGAKNIIWQNKTQKIANKLAYLAFLIIIFQHGFLTALFLMEHTKNILGLFCLLFFPEYFLYLILTVKGHYCVQFYGFICFIKQQLCFKFLRYFLQWVDFAISLIKIIIYLFQLMKRKYHKKLEQIDNEIDLQKRTIFKVDILKDFQTRSKNNPVNQNKKLITGEEVQKKKIIIKEAKMKPNFSQVNPHLNDFNNHQDFYSERNHYHQARIIREDQHNMIKKSPSNILLNSQNKEGSKQMVNRFNTLKDQNPQTQSLDSLIIFNQNFRQLDSHQPEQNTPDINLNSIIQTKGVIDIPNEQRLIKKIYRLNRFQNINQNISLNNYPIKQEIEKSQRNFIYQQKSQIVQAVQTEIETIHRIQKKPRFKQFEPISEVALPNEYSDEIFQTISSTQYQRCNNCMRLSKYNLFQLCCSHYYHIECLDQMITKNITSGNTKFFCLCNKKIAQKIILNLLKDNKQMINTLFNNQLQYLIKEFQKDKRNAHIKFDKYPQIQVQQGIIVWE